MSGEFHPYLVALDVFALVWLVVVAVATIKGGPR